MPKYGKIRLKVGGEMNNEKGLTLVELFAAILLVSLIIIPSLTALTGNFRVNTQMMERSSASVKASQTIQGFQNLNIRDFDNLLQEYPYIKFTGEEIEEEGCDLLLDYTNTPRNDIVTFNNEKISCQMIFDSKIKNLEFNHGNMQVFVYPYSITAEPDNEDLTEEEITNAREAYLDEIDEIDESDMPDQVYAIIENIPVTQTDFNIYRIIVWIEYATDRTITRTGVASPRLEVRP